MAFVTTAAAEFDNAIDLDGEWFITMHWKRMATVSYYYIFIEMDSEYTGTILIPGYGSGTIDKYYFLVNIEITLPMHTPRYYSLYGVLWHNGDMFGIAEQTGGHTDSGYWIATKKLW